MLWWNKDGVGSNTSSFSSGSFYVSPSGGTTTPYVVLVQVADGTSISTLTVSEWYSGAKSDTCHFIAQVTTTRG